MERVKNLLRRIFRRNEMKHGFNGVIQGEPTILNWKKDSVTFCCVGCHHEFTVSFIVQGDKLVIRTYKENE